jgi:hypothetical protein
VHVEGDEHEVIVRHGFFSARREVLLDGRKILDIRPGLIPALKLWNTATDHPFTIAGHPAWLRIDPTVDNVTYRKSLIVDGRDVETGTAVEMLPQTPAGAHEGRWLAGYGGLLVQPFALAAIVLGNVGRDVSGHALWVLGGFIGAFICWSASRLVGDTVGRKLLLCAAVVTALYVAPRL